jgi:clan AA aspartic protease
MTMGLIKTKVTLHNALDNRLAPYEAEALVDTGALLLCIPEHVAVQLQLPKLQEREVSTADGRKHTCPYVGPVEVTFENRSCFVGALVFGDEVLLGSVPMEDLDLVISPAKQSVTVNPESPNLPTAIVK